MRQGLLLLFLLILAAPVSAAVQDLPRIYHRDIQYEGAFRLPAATFGTSSLNYAQGPIAYNSANHSLFIVGHAHHQNIAEFGIPPLVKSTEIAHLNMARQPLQAFTGVLDRATGGNPEGIDRVGGMHHFPSPDGGQLLINAYEYYDAPGNNQLTSIIARDSSSLETCTIEGYTKFAGGAGHTSGWISPIPRAWQSQLGGTHITGQSSGIPIISRTSVGPSAFSFTPDSFLGETLPTTVPTTMLLDFSLANPLHEDLSNSSLSNDIWTHLSRVVYGMIVPGTRTYLTIGKSGGHQSGVCYKCTQDNGRLCGGYCAPDAEDYSHFYWLWDVNDLLDVKNGRKQGHELRPYNYGEFSTPFATNSFGGGAFDEENGLLYLTVQKADREQGTYSNPPVVVAFSFLLPRSTHPPLPANNLLLDE